MKVNNERSPVTRLAKDPNDPYAWYVLMEHGDVPYSFAPNLMRMLGLAADHDGPPPADDSICPTVGFLVHDEDGPLTTHYVVFTHVSDLIWPHDPNHAHRRRALARYMAIVGHRSNVTRNDAGAMT